MSRRLPNLNAVRAFDAAARHQSFSRAADELGVTHGSVSRYIKNLEADLGLQLFERRHRQVALTPAGARYAGTVAEALVLISLETGTRVAGGARGKVVLDVDSDLALLWLMPRLDRAGLDALGIDIELRSDPEPPRTIAPSTDLAITWGPIDAPGYSREPLLSFTSFPVCAPDLAAEMRRTGLAGQRLIHDRSMGSWDEILRREGLALSSAAGHLTFHRTYLCLDAAAQGLGIAIGDDVTTAEMLKAGRLIRPFGPDMPGRKAFYLSTSSRSPIRPPVLALRNWLLAQAEDHAQRIEGEASGSD
ncbi:LysR substrate-binding domain-containing protein [Paracoccus saliphilus]|uniref:LysR family transcriptional regulator n=1 Tax=Paracoccus saliphilus TaxID=405559 RepID=A0AA45W720_9RHOB|nr:LysR substrate-binding domain-containing protein [Paracoccus saliphilus]WCR03922.1 LysR family transcriptional regulator [Paracoccus saliphilus]SIT06267.1 transcriptional regulator, LysR family [Paracoccus saliphilus]